MITIGQAAASHGRSFLGHGRRLSYHGKDPLVGGGGSDRRLFGRGTGRRPGR